MRPRLDGAACGIAQVCRHIDSRPEENWRWGAGENEGSHGCEGCVTTGGVSPAENGGVTVDDRARAMPRVHMSMSSQSRKSPLGAFTAFTITRSVKDRSRWSREPTKVWCPRGWMAI